MNLTKETYKVHIFAPSGQKFGTGEDYIILNVSAVSIGDAKVQAMCYCTKNAWHLSGYEIKTIEKSGV